MSDTMIGVVVSLAVVGVIILMCVVGFGIYALIAYLAAKDQKKSRR